jgi:eukaryotic-like serine/threonine-protein kinase
VLDSATRVIRFGPFEVDLESGELYKAGKRVPLQQQPFRILVRLLERPGRPVTREELRSELWPADTFVDFDHGLSAAVRRLREALGDTIENPRFIETLPRRGYRFIAPFDVPAVSREPAAQDPSTTPARRRPALMAVLVLAGAALAIGGAYGAVKSSRLAWAYRGLPEIERLAGEEHDLAQAFRLWTAVARVIPDDAEVARLRGRVARWPAVETEPPGADVEVKGYLESDAEWIHVGRTPIGQALMPAGPLRWRISRSGWEPMQVALPWRAAVNRFVFRLTRQGEAPEGMILIRGGSIDLSDIQISQDYWMDRHEVTNRAFKQFVEAGGYTRREFWRQAFILDGHEVTWDQAMQRFRDATGRAGPSTWHVGSYPDGQDDHPVGGVSWYEADAYAAFVGKSLPSVDHWLYASGVTLPFGELPVRLGNFSAESSLAVGRTAAISTFGFHDMAGNVREWAWNADSTGLRYLMGGGWGDAPYVFFRHPDSNSPWDRAPQNGLRLVTYVNPPDESQLAPLAELSARDLGRETPASDEVFEAFQRLFAYERTDLDPRVDTVDDEPTGWRDEAISFNAAYGDARMVAHLLLPKGGVPPYQVVVVYPGDGAFATPWAHPTRPVPIDFILRSGRAVLYPLYRGMHDRKAPPVPDLKSLEYRMRVVEWYQDLARSLDYVETRSDIDLTRVAYYGISRGALHGAIFLALEPRFKTGVLRSGGLVGYRQRPETDAFHYAPRVKVPVLMLHGEFDAIRPLATSGAPLFQLLGTPPDHKRLFVAPGGGHLLPHNVVIREALDWFDRYLGRVGT